MAKRKRSVRLFEPDLVKEAIKQSFIKLNPVVMVKNPSDVHG
jgi:High-affinity K+ transport system, ATPase chain B